MIILLLVILIISYILYTVLNKRSTNLTTTVATTAIPISTATKDTATKDTATKDTATKDTATKDTITSVATDITVPIAIQDVTVPVIIDTTTKLPVIVTDDIPASIITTDVIIPDIDCIVSDWISGTCDSTCGIGNQIQTRSIITQSQNNGKICPPLTQNILCYNDTECPIDCSLNNWSSWTDCDNTCGVGTQSRSTTIKIQPKNNGIACPPLTQSQTCSSNLNCPVDCSYNNISDWSTCSTTCGDGIQTRTKKDINNNSLCPILIDQQNCTDISGCAPIDCSLNTWSDWTSCNTNCGTGIQTRQTTIKIHPLYNGLTCPPLIQTQNCSSTVDCPIDCVVSDWSPLSSCSNTCGSGIQTKTRTVITQPQNNGQVCPPLNQDISCNDLSGCPIDCVLSEWSPLSSCSNTCGSGIASLTRTVITPAKNNGKACQFLKYDISCNNKSGCPIDCVVSDWSPLSSCSNTCGDGIQTKTRTVITPPLNNGQMCPSLKQDISCNNNSGCPVDCIVSDWSPLSSCSNTCGTGIQTKTRNVLTQPQNDGIDCPPLKQNVICNNTDGCDVNCAVSNWTDWSTCDTVCGTGKQTRTRTITTPQKNKGIICPPLIDTKTCNVTSGCVVDCSLNSWSDWSSCSNTCGDGIQSRTTTVKIEPRNNGLACPPLQQDISCNNKSTCPIDCEVSNWSDWSSCSNTCGQGFVQRTRSVITPSLNGGSICPKLTDISLCYNSSECPIDSVVSNWSEWTACSTTCGIGSQSRTRTVIVNPAFGGIPIPILEQDTSCNATSGCPVDCVVSDWSIFSTCSQTCGGGTHVHTRGILEPSKNNGAACPPLSEILPCNTQPCPIDCVVSDWTDWSLCTETCGGGTKTRTRNITTPSAYGGDICPVLSETITCNTRACPVDCVMSNWSSVTNCNVPCGVGYQESNRSIITEPINGGLACPIEQINEYPPRQLPFPNMTSSTSKVEGLPVYKCTVLNSGYGNGEYSVFGNSNNPSNAFIDDITSSSISSGKVFPWFFGIRLPNKIVLKYYKLININNSNSMPNKWIINGSNNGITWNIIDSRSDVKWFDGQSQTFTINSSIIPYLFYNITIISNIPTSIGRFKLFGITNPIVNISEFPPRDVSFPTMTQDSTQRLYNILIYKNKLTNSTYGNGQYIAFSNTEFSTDMWCAKSAFSDLSENNYGWQNGDGPRFNNTNDAINPPLFGLQLPYPIILQGYQIISAIATQSPLKWYIQGSNDGINWNIIDSRFDISNNNNIRNFDISNNFNSYNWYNIVMLRNNSSINDWISVKRLRLLGLNIPLDEYPPRQQSFPLMLLDPQIINDIQVYKCDVSGSTYGNGSYMAFSSSELSQSKWCAGSVFADYTDSGINTLGYKTALDISGSCFFGLRLPYQIVLKSYGIISGSSSPNNWIVQGSNDGLIWNNISTESNVIWSSDEQYQTFLTYDNETKYNWFRLYITTITPIAITRLKLFGITIPLNEYPPHPFPDMSLNNITIDGINVYKCIVSGSSYGNGEYMSFSNSQVSLNKICSKAVFADSINSYFQSSDNTYINSNDYTTESINNPSYVGIKLPYRVLIKSYALIGNSIDITQYPTKWILQGSIDGITWNIIDQQSNIIWNNLGDYYKYPIYNSTEYDWYKLIFIRNNSLQPNNVSLGKLKLYGSEINILSFNPCNTKPCPIDCKVGDWTPWSDCDKICGPGNMTRTRPIIIAPKYGGASCLPTTDISACAYSCQISSLINDTGFINDTSGNYSYYNLTDLPSIPKFPVSLGAFNNNSNFITQSTSLNPIFVGIQNNIGNNYKEPSRFELKYWSYNSFNNNKIGAKIAFTSNLNINNSQSANIVFYTASASSYNDDDTIERLRILDNGYIGVNNNTPSSILDISGNTTVLSLSVNGIITTNQNNIILSNDITNNTLNGLCFNNLDPNYMIYRAPGSWKTPYVPLIIQFYSGINFITGESTYPVNINRKLIIGNVLSSGGEIKSNTGFRGTGAGGTPYIYPQNNTNRFGQWRIGDGVVGGWAGLHFQSTGDLYLLMGNNNIGNGVWAESGADWMWYCDQTKNFHIYNNLNVTNNINASVIIGQAIFNNDIWHTSTDSINRFNYTSNNETSFCSGNGNYLFKALDNISNNVSLTSDSHLDIINYITAPTITASTINCIGSVTTAAGTISPVIPWVMGTHTDVIINQIFNLNCEPGNTGTSNGIFHNGFQGLNPSGDNIAWNYFRLIFRGCSMNGDSNHTFQMMSYYYSRNWIELGEPFSVVTSQTRGYSTIITPWFRSIGNDVPGYGIKSNTNETFRIGNIYFQFSNNPYDLDELALIKHEQEICDGYMPAIKSFYETKGQWAGKFTMTPIKTSYHDVGSCDCYYSYINIKEPNEKGFDSRRFYITNNTISGMGDFDTGLLAKTGDEN